MNTNNTQRSQDGAYASEPRVYELGYHILPTVNEGNLGEERDALVAIITKFNGVVISEGEMALVDLAYDMSKIIDNKRNIFSQGFFGWIKFDLVPEAADALADEVEAQANVLRSIVVKTVRENTIVSEEPYRTAKGNTSVSAVDTDVEEVEMPVAETAPTEAASVETEVSTEAEDLTKIEGIGPKIAEIFAAAGIKTFADLSASKVGDLRDILEENKLSSHDPKTWSKQATLAKNGKWDKLAELQEELKGGKEA